MPTTTNYGWTTPADTDLVKDGAAAIRTLGSSIDTTVKNLNPETTTGDISYRSATANTNTRLAIGTANQVLRVNSGATAPEWATLSSWAPSYPLLNSGGTALTGASTITVNVSSYDSYYVYWVGASTDTGASQIRLRMNGDTGANYNSYSVGYIGTGVNQSLQTGATSFHLGTIGNDAAGTAVGSVVILGGKTTSLKTIQGVCLAGGGTTNGNFASSGHYNASAAVTSISLICSAGNFDAGTLYIYGG